eukprot:Transcript_18739.p2 GENE.Transcript_18739~~Transcript_18739.p2  ORF type:complete len:296 (-),score=102.36 Transcript_18739:1230-2117(-)
MDMRARAADVKSERESIIEDDGDARKNVRDGAVPCCVLTMLLVVAAGLGAAAVYISIAAFDPEHSTSSLALLARPTQNTSSYRFEASSIDADTWKVASVTNAKGHALTWADAIEGLKDGSLGPSLNAALAGSPHAAFFWETPPTTLEGAAARPFEFVTVRAPNLEDVEPDPKPFSATLSGCAGAAEARSFANLGGDATLVAPCAGAAVAPSTYAHIAKFVRDAPAAQRDAFWRAVGRAVGETLRARGAAPTWVSTEGSGVSWLHVRLDSTPKYYHHRSFMSPRAEKAAAARERRA